MSSKISVIGFLITLSLLLKLDSNCADGVLSKLKAKQNDYLVVVLGSNCPLVK